MPKPNDSTQINAAIAEDEASIRAEEQAGKETQETQEVGEKTQEQIDWENEQNPYKKRYGDSQGQIQPLVRTLQQFAEYDHNTKTWKPKTQATQTQQPAISDAEVEKLLEGYDPEFKSALVKIIAPLRKEVSDFRKFREESAFMTDYNSGITSARAQAIEEFGSEFDFAKEGKFNTASPLYKLANEILTSKYAQFNPDGTFHRYSSPDAEYMATVEAYAIMSKKAKQAPIDKGKFGAIQGKGSKAAGVKKVLSYEEYSKLSTEAKDAYDLQQSG